jgi:hypothetical protein
MADLAGAPARAQKGAFHHDARADAGADRDDEEVLVISAHPV